MPQIGSRDLSEVFRKGILHVTIEGVGELGVQAAPGGETISSLVNQAQVFITGESSIVSDVRNCPWSLVSFDANKKTVVVRPVR